MSFGTDRYSVLAVMLVLLAAATTAHADHGANETGAAHGPGTGWFTPDSPLYGIEVAVDRAGMMLGLKNAGTVAKKRANEARAMAEDGNWKAAQRAANGLKQVSAYAEDGDTAEFGQALSVLEDVMADAPENARDGLRTAMEHVKTAGPDQAPGQNPTGSQDGPGNDTDASQPDSSPENDTAPNDGVQPGPFPMDREEPESNNVIVLLENTAFDQDPITAKPGQDIVFVNRDSVNHTVTIPDADIDKTLEPRDRFTITLDTPGTYSLNCMIHSGMDATIEITE